MMEAMWRSLFSVLLAAALGALLVTTGFILFAAGREAHEPTRAVLALTAGAMIFTVPGAIMLGGAQAILRERRLASGHRDALAALIGTVAGAVVLAFISPPMAGLGALYGLATGVALICVQRLFAGAAGSR
jgi:hypothetical protein